MEYSELGYFGSTFYGVLKKCIFAKNNLYNLKFKKMKKVLFLLIIVGMTFNVMGQKPHKATGDKPISSMEYSFTTVDDSTLSHQTYYTYNSNQRIIKEIADYSSFSMQDSTLATYDAKGRAVSVNRFSDGDLSMYEVWIYDDQNSKIEQYLYSNGDVQSSAYTVFYGVKDMDAIDGGISFSLMGSAMTLRDCDSIYMNAYDANSSSWIPMGKMYPTSQSGNITKAKYIIDVASAANMFGDDLPIDELPFDEMEINMVLAYQSGKLLTIKGSTSIDIGMGIPIPLTNFMTLTNQYNGNLLIETISAIDISIMGSDMAYMGTREVHSYNQEDNLLCTESYSTEVKNTWTLESKIWYSYQKEDGYDDLEIISLNSPYGDSDEKGKEITISVHIENSSDSIIFSDVNINAIVKDGSGEIIADITEVLPAINPLSVITYWFDEKFTVPDDDKYTITIYIESEDQYPLNDTLHITRTTHEVPINSISCTEYIGISMEQNIPNPAGTSTRIEYNVVEAGQVNFNLYSINGQLLLQQTEYVTEGSHQIELNTANLANGIYFYSMDINGKRVTKKMSVKK